MHFYRFILLVLIAGPSLLTAQQETVNWIFSFHTQSPPDGIPGTYVHFNPGLTYMSDTFPISCMGGCTNISDSQGNLLFFTNGINVYNPDGSVMTNGHYINPGNINDEFTLIGYPETQGSVILPTPDNPQSYHLFHVAANDTEQYGATGTRLYYSVIRRNPTNGALYVAEKNHLLLTDTLGVGNITATKHANGRDWWVIMPRIASNKYRVYLLDPRG